MRVLRLNGKKMFVAVWLVALVISASVLANAASYKSAFLTADKPELLHTPMQN